jgi:hypothetical protein
MQISSRIDTVWKVQVGVLWVFGAVTLLSPISKADPYWILMCLLTLSVGFVEWTLHEKQRHANRLREIDVEFWQKQRANWEQAKKDVDAAHERNREFLKTIESAISDLESYRSAWKREVNGYARQMGQPVPFPSVDVVDQPKTN